MGYPCANRTSKLHGNHTFRQANFSKEKLIQTVQKNLDHVYAMLKYNVKNDFKFFRIGSSFVPFASHDLCRSLQEDDQDPFDWRDHFKDQLKEIGDYVKSNNMRISMHPDHFVLLNSPKDDITQKSIKELQYHADLLNTMELDTTHKFQIHVGGVYGDKKSAIERFVEKYKTLNEDVRTRLVIENDDRLFSLKDCIEISKQTGVPILFDTLHHECLHNGEDMIDAFKQAAGTWDESKDGIPLIDYSSQDPEGKVGKHAPSLDLKHFKRVICKGLMSARDSNDKFYKFDVMLEIKDKELAAHKCKEAFDKYIERYSKIEKGLDVSDVSEDEDEDEEEEKKIIVKKSPAKAKKATLKKPKKESKKRSRENDQVIVEQRVTRSKTRKLNSIKE